MSTIQCIKCRIDLTHTIICICPCKHTFCLQCITIWKECSLCKKVTFSENFDFVYLIKKNLSII